MKSLNDYFKDKTKNLSFIEIKPNSYVDINGYKVDENTPLPVVLDELLGEIKSGTAYEEIKMSSIINGIIYTIGVDPEFKYCNTYKKILFKYDEKIEDYILYNAIQFLKNNKLEEGLVYLRALVNINDRNEKALYNYALGLEEKGKKFYEIGSKEKGDMFLNKARNTLEDIIDVKPNYSLAYYKLGYYYRNRQQFEKCQIIWQKFMRLNDDVDRIEEIRQNLLLIDDCVQYEKGYNEVLSGKPLEGLEKLLPLEEKYDNWWNLFFMIGLAYRTLGEYQKAKGYFGKVLEVKANQADALNEMGLCDANLGNLEESIESFNKAIEKKPNDYEIICNRGMILIQIGDMEKAEKDIEYAYHLNPKDEITISCKAYLDQVKRG